VSLAEITNPEDHKASNDLRKEGIESIMMKKESQIEQRLSDIRGYVKALGFDSIFDVAVAEANSTNVEVKRRTKRWLHEGGDILRVVSLRKFFDISVIIPENQNRFYSVRIEIKC